MSDFSNLSAKEKIEKAFDLYRKFTSFPLAAAASGIPKTTLLRWASRHPEYNSVQNEGIPTPKKAGMSITEDTVTIISPLSTDAVSPKDMLIRHKQNPDNFTMTKMKTNQWGDADNPKLQICCTWVPKIESFVSPAYSDRKEGWKPKKLKKAKKNNGVLRFMILADPHAPLHEQVLTDAAAALAREVQPDKIISLGDSSDNSPWTRHRKNPRKDLDHTAQEAVDGTYDWLAQIADAAPNAEKIVLAGNHDWWIYDRVLETIPQLATLKVAHSDERILDLERILRMDELGWKLASTQGGRYHDSVHAILDDVIGIHGVKTGKHGGALVEMATWEGATVIQGHDHKQTLARHVKRRVDGTESAHWSWSIGAMSRRDLGYDHKRDVHQGFGMMTVWPDGRWHPEIVSFDPQKGDVTYRDWRYKP